MPHPLMKRLSSRNPRVRYPAARRAIELSERNPKALVRELDTFAGYLGGENRILKWSAARVVGNLAAADRAGRVDRLVPRLWSLVKSGELVTASNAVKGLGAFARNRPKQRRAVLRRMAEVDKFAYPTAECRNIVVGQALDVMAEWPEVIARDARMKDFVRRATANRRPATRKRAQRLVKKIGVSS